LSGNRIFRKYEPHQICYIHDCINNDKPTPISKPTYTNSKATITDFLQILEKNATQNHQIVGIRNMKAKIEVEMPDIIPDFHSGLRNKNSINQGVANYMMSKESYFELSGSTSRVMNVTGTMVTIITKSDDSRVIPTENLVYTHKDHPNRVVPTVVCSQYVLPNDILVNYALNDNYHGLSAILRTCCTGTKIIFVGHMITAEPGVYRVKGETTFNGDQTKQEYQVEWNVHKKPTLRAFMLGENVVSMTALYGKTYGPHPIMPHITSTVVENCMIEGRSVSLQVEPFNPLEIRFDSECRVSTVVLSMHVTVDRIQDRLFIEGGAVEPSSIYDKDLVQIVPDEEVAVQEAKRFLANYTSNFNSSMVVATLSRFLIFKGRTDSFVGKYYEKIVEQIHEQSHLFNLKLSYMAGLVEFKKIIYNISTFTIYMPFLFFFILHSILLGVIPFITMIFISIIFYITLIGIGSNMRAYFHLVVQDFNHQYVYNFKSLAFLILYLSFIAYKFINLDVVGDIGLDTGGVRY
jgi:hypothetical protein